MLAAIWGRPSALATAIAAHNYATGPSLVQPQPWSPGGASSAGGTDPTGPVDYSQYAPVDYTPPDIPDPGIDLSGLDVGAPAGNDYSSVTATPAAAAPSSQTLVNTTPRLYGGLSAMLKGSAGGGGLAGYGGVGTRRTAPTTLGRRSLSSILRAAQARPQ